MQLAEVSQPPSLPLPGSGEPAVALDGASFAWTAASEGGQPTVQDVSLEVCLFQSGVLPVSSERTDIPDKREIAMLRARLARDVACVFRRYALYWTS